MPKPDFLGFRPMGTAVLDITQPILNVFFCAQTRFWGPLLLGGVGCTSQYKGGSTAPKKIFFGGLSYQGGARSAEENFLEAPSSFISHAQKISGSGVVRDSQSVPKDRCATLLCASAYSFFACTCTCPLTCGFPPTCIGHSARSHASKGEGKGIQGSGSSA